MKVRGFRSELLVPLLALLALASVSQTAAQDGVTTFVIHKAECPAGYAGGDLFADCHDDRLRGVTFGFAVGAPEDRQTAATDADGVAVFETSAATTGVSVSEAPPYDLAEYLVYCSLDGGGDEVPFDYDEDIVGIVFDAGTVADGSTVVCDWYNIPVSDGTDEGNDGTDVGASPTLPNTGIGFIAPDQPSAPALALALAALALVAATVVRLDGRRFA